MQASAGPVSSPLPTAQGFLRVCFTWLSLNFLMSTMQAAVPAAHGSERTANKHELSKELLGPNSGEHRGSRAGSVESIQAQGLALWLLSKQLGLKPILHPPLWREDSTGPYQSP